MAEIAPFTLIFTTYNVILEANRGFYGSIYWQKT